MGRPRKKITKLRVNLSLDPQLHAEAQNYAYQQNESLSSLVERLLGETINRPKTKGTKGVLEELRRLEAEIRGSVESKRQAG